MYRSNDKYYLSRKGRYLVSVIVSSFLFFFIWIVSLFDQPPGLNVAAFFLISLSGFVVWESILLYRKSANSTESILFWLSSAAVGTLSFSILFYVFKWADFFFYHSEPPTWFHMLVAVIIGALLSTLIIILSEVMKWRSKWLESQLQNEMMQKDQIKSRLTALQNQIDPHFLFNNLNTLYSLITTNPEKAADFLEELAEIYRYVLTSKDELTMPATVEWKMAMCYLNLLKTRYGKAIRDKIKLAEADLDGYFLPPLSIQQLVENAVKHNRVDLKYPLTIQFTVQNNYLEMVNNLNEKKSILSNGNGLSNLRSRFEYLTSMEMVVKKTSDQFIIRLPLLMKRNAGNHH